MKNNFLKIIFSSGLQAIAVQVLGVLFFLVISFSLSKEDFGVISGANAIAMMLTALLSFGLDQVVVRRIAASSRSDWAAVAYLFHSMAGSVLVFIILLALRLFVHNSTAAFIFLPWFFAAQGITYIGTPLKQFLNARQNFTPYGVIAVCSNLVKLALAYLFIVKHRLSLETVIAILIFCALIEFIALLFYILKYTNLQFRFKKLAYFKLVRESLPQYMSVIFDSSLSRMDWILMLILSTSAMTGEYGFAYRAFELARLPMSIIGPILLTYFARMFAGGVINDTAKTGIIKQLFVLEIFLAMFIPLVLNVIWSPLLDAQSHGKYGSSNACEFMLLSLCIPMQFAINLLWTLAFSARKYRQTTTITIYSAIVNVALNLVLIPLYGGTGAAIAFLLTTVLQMCGYYFLVRRVLMHIPLKQFILLLLLAAAGYWASVSLTHIVLLQILVSICLYAGAAILLKLVRKEHLHTLKLLMRK